MNEMDTEARCRSRAHELWEAAGRPDGRDLEHWTSAQTEILGTSRPQTASQDDDVIHAYEAGSDRPEAAATLRAEGDRPWPALCP